jgi:hypothetical protein
LLLVVRNLDTSALKGQALCITPSANGQVMAQILVGAVLGGAFKLGASSPTANQTLKPGQFGGLFVGHEQLVCQLHRRRLADGRHL